MSATATAPATTAALAARGLCSGYQGVPAIEDVDLEVRAGEMVLLAGPNGAGKSTTVMTLAGAITPPAGHVEIDGVPSTLPILADELSLGLAPIVVKRLLEALRRADDGAAAVLLVEQHCGWRSTLWTTATSCAAAGSS